jgi:Na+-transporting NADH:ubiquinone oxidoreductase subunit NqrB
MFLVSAVGILDYILEKSKEANLVSAFKGISSSSWIGCTVFFMLKVCGSRISWLILSVDNFDSLYAVALFQFITGRMGQSGLCILIRPLIIVGKRLRLTYFLYVPVESTICLKWLFP